MMISKKTAESCSPRNYLHSTIFLHIICFYRLSINFFSYFQKSTFCRRFPFLRIWAGLMMSVKEPWGCWTLEANWTSKLHSFKAFWRTALRQGPAPDKYLVENFTCHKEVLKGAVKINTKNFGKSAGAPKSIFNEWRWARYDNKQKMTTPRTSMAKWDYITSCTLNTD